MAFVVYLLNEFNIQFPGQGDNKQTKSICCILDSKTLIVNYF